MASLIPGFEYDVFISYRQKDNKRDGWVTDFVNTLRGELESTFKEDISVYFDINPHDGLLETHDVDASLKTKLKCLIFIPIISRTYCDPNSFAWEHEFKAFVDQASDDQFGLKVILPNGNVAARVLPIRIHDLDVADKNACESVLGGVLRGIDFIYKEPGVNRPLTINDDKEINLNKTRYRNQINKAANAINDIVLGLRAVSDSVETRKSVVTFEDRQTGDDNGRETKRSINHKSKQLQVIFLLLILGVAGTVIMYRVFNFGNADPHHTEPEKSVAVLPFVNDSPDQENTYFINGIMDEILNNLQKIKDFRVLSRTSTEQFRGMARLTVPEIAEKLNVNYIVEGSGQKYGNTFRLRVQLISAKNEKHLWAEAYEQEIKETKDIFKIQSHIAQEIAAELKANITPVEKQIIEKTPTANLTAYDFYLRGMEEINENWKSGVIDQARVKRAEFLFKKALEYDHTFAPGHIGLASVFRQKFYSERDSSEKFLDSSLVHADIALLYDDHLADAHCIRGQYFSDKGNINKANEEYDKAISLNPNDWHPYWLKTWLAGDDLLNSIENNQRAISLNKDSQLPEFLRRIANSYFQAGFPEKGKEYNLEALNLDGDSSQYLSYLARCEYINGNYRKQLDLLKKCYHIDSTGAGINISLAYYYLNTGQVKESLKYCKKYADAKNTGSENNYWNELAPVGYVYWVNGYRKEAEYYFDKQLESSNRWIKTFTLKDNFGDFYQLAEVYAFRGDKDKAFENLKLFNQKKRFEMGWVYRIKINPLFNNIRKEPEFQQIVRDVESKYQAEHDRVSRWLEENSRNADASNY
jgi:TolB-like protein